MLDDFQYFGCVSHTLYGFNYIKPDQAEKTIAISAAAGNIGIIVGQL